MASDEEVGRQILSTFMQHKVGASGVLRRNIYRCERCRFPTRVEQGRRKWLDQDQIARSLHLRPHRSWSCCGIERWASAEAFSLTRHALIWPERVWCQANELDALDAAPGQRQTCER